MIKFSGYSFMGRETLTLKLFMKVRMASTLGSVEKECLGQASTLLRTLHIRTTMPTQ